VMGLTGEVEADDRAAGVTGEVEARVGEGAGVTALSAAGHGKLPRAGRGVCVCVCVCACVCVCVCVCVCYVHSTTDSCVMCVLTFVYVAHSNRLRVGQAHRQR